MRNKKPPLWGGYFPIRTSNLAERFFVKKARKDGWEVIKSGWPDFLLVKNKSIRFVEVKQSARPFLSKKQQLVFRILRQNFGIEVELYIS